MELAVLDRSGKDTGRKITLNETIFGIEPNDHSIYLDVRYILANSRQGTHKTKGRSEISMSSKKVYRQKGTGNARSGSRRNPLWRKGGTMFGPQPRDHSFKLNKKLRKLARKSVLAHKANDNAIIVLSEFSLETPKTKEFVEILKSLNIAGEKSLFLVPGETKNLYLSARNLQKTDVLRVEDVNTYDVLHADKLVILEPALDRLNNLLG